MRTLVATTLIALSMPGAAAASVATDARKAAVKAGFSGIADRAAKAALPSLILDRKVLKSTPATLGTSRLGGDPDLPRGATWPRCGKQRQSFLLQLRLSDLPAAAKDLRRLGGHLLVFTDVELDEYDPEFDMRFGIWAGRCSRVVYAKPGRPLVRRSPPKGAEVMPLRPAAITPRLHADVPDTILDQQRLGPPLRDVVLPSVDAGERWSSMRYGFRGRKPSTFEHRTLGYIDPPNGDDDCYDRTQRARRPWRHLITVNYDDQIGFEVADGGRLQLAISPADLRVRRFSRVCATFNSG